MDKKKKKILIIGIIICGIIGGIFTYFTIVPLTPTSTDPAPVLDDIIPNPDTDGDVSLTWNFDLSAYPNYGGEVTLNYYLIYRKVGSGDWVQLASSGKNAYYTDLGLPSGTYSYYVMACLVTVAPWGNTNGISGNSNVKTVIVNRYTPPPPTVPSAPALQSIPSPDTDGIIDLRWNAVDGATDYWVYKQFNGGSITQVITQYTRTSLRITNTEEGTYEYSVKAHNYVGYSGLSNTISVVIDFPEVAPPGPIPGEESPSNPTISINEGATITDFEISLTLSCDDADEMRFKIDSDSENGVWSIYESYATTKALTLPYKFSTTNIHYEVSVQFYNKYGTSEIVYDEIEFIVGGPEPTPPIPSPPTPEPTPTDTTNNQGIIYGIIIAIVIGISTIIILEVVRRKRKRKI